MRVEHFRVFTKVVDTGSFTQAARLLKQPVSRVSRTIQALEEEIGTSLLYRTTRQLNLTQAGKSFYENIQKPLVELELALDAAKGANSAVSGLLRITGIGDFAPLMTLLVAKFRERYPNTRIELILEDRVLDFVKESIDVGIRIGTLEDSSLRSVRLGEIGAIFVASPDYLFRAPAIDSLESLSKHSLLYFGEPTKDPRQTWKVLSRGAGKSHKIKADPVYLSSHTGAILNLALNGEGVALLPKFLCLEPLRAGRLTHVLRTYETKPLPVHLVWNQNAKAQAKVHAFIEFAKRELPESFAFSG